MSREAHVRFWEGVGVKLPRATHLVVLNAAHLRRLLRDYLLYYHSARTHLSLDKDAPEPRAVERLDQGRIVETPLVGGLHHRYSRRAA
jgi:putative transposase